MKQKLFSIFAVLFLALNAGVFLLPQTASAACNYFVDFKGDKVQATPSDTITYTATVIRSGNLADCKNEVYLTLYAKGKNGEINITTAQEQFREIPSFGSAIQKNFNINLGTFDRSNLLNLNQLEVKVVVKTVIVLPNPSVQLTESSYWSTGITGSATTSGTLKFNVYFQPNAAEYKKGDKISVKAKITSGLSDISSSVLNIAYRVFVNGTKIGEFTKPIQDYRVTDQYYDNLEVSDLNKFGNGINTVKVELWQSNSLKLGEGSATLKASGLTNNVPVQTTGGTGTGPATGAGAGSGTSGGRTANTAVDCDKNPSDCLQNPLPAQSLIDFFLIATRGFLAIMGVVATVFVVVGGFRMVVSSGNEEAYGAAKKTITWAILGMVVALLSFSIIAIVQNLLKVKTPAAPSGTERRYLPTDKIFSLAQVAYAQTTPSPAPATDPCDSFEKQFQITGGTNIVSELKLPKFCNATDASLFVFNMLTRFAGTVTVLFIMYGGYVYLTSAGNEENSEKGKKIITTAALGLAVILMATALVSVIAGLLQR